MEGDDKYGALRQLLKERCSGSNFRDDDLKNLVDTGFETEADLSAATTESLTSTLPGRHGEVAVLLKTFSAIAVDRHLLKEIVAEEVASQMFKRHKTAYTTSIPIPVEEVKEISLWEQEVERGGVPCTTEDVNTLLDPERALLADLRYLHLWHIARNIPVDDIISMKTKRRRGEADLEKVYYGHALAIMRASAQGQPEVFVVGEDHPPYDSARGDLRVYVRNMLHPSEMKAVNVSSNTAVNVTGIFSNRAAFGKLHQIIRTKLLKDGGGGTFLCTFLNRIECIWFAKFEYDSECHMISCQVAPEIPAKGLMPSAQICDGIIVII